MLHGCVLFTLQNSLLNRWSRHVVVCLSAALLQAELTALKDEVVKLKAAIATTSQTNLVSAQNLNLLFSLQRYRN